MPLVLPILIPLITAALLLVAWRNLWLQRGLGILGAASLLGSTLVLLRRVHLEGIQSVQVGAWPAPFGITLIADHFAALMLVMTGILGLAVAIYSVVDIDRQRQLFGFYPLLHFLLMGVCGAFLTGDIFNLYVWFEVLLISSFVLLPLGSERGQLEGALKYVTLNLISSFLLLTSIGILYGLTGTLNMADVAVKLRQLQNPGLITTLSMLFLVALGIKSAVFPLYFWLPASYPTPPAAVSALFAGLLTKVGVYALIRVFTLFFTSELVFTQTLILTISGLTMVTGVLGAIAQGQIRRILSTHVVSQIGYMTMGLGLFTPLGLAGAVFFIVHQIFVKANLFLVSGIISKLRGTDRLDRLGDLYRDKPWLAILFAVPALSLAGLPPLSGFVGKLALVRAGLEAEQYLITATALGVSILTLFSMTKIWNGAFWQPAAETDPDTGHPIHPYVRQDRITTREQLVMALPTAALGALAILMGVCAEPVFALCQEAADELLNPQRYITHVLGESP